MRTLRVTTLLTISLLSMGLLAMPAATAGEAFINGQLGRISLDNDALDADSSTLQAVGAGYRWGIGPVKAGLEAGLGRIGETRGHHGSGADAQDVTLRSRHYSIGANARIKPPLLPVQFIGRAGYLGMRNTLETRAVGATATTSGNSGGTYAGVGIGTTVLPLLDVTLMLTRYRYAQLEHDGATGRHRLSDDKRDARSLGLSVEYRF